MKLDKDKIFSMIVYRSCVELELPQDKGNRLMEIITNAFADIDLETEKNALSNSVIDNEVLIKNFVGCKKLIGIRDSTLRSYVQSLKMFLAFNNMSLLQVSTNDLRRFLIDYESRVSNVTADNARRNLNSFFQFMENEGYIPLNPCKKIPHIRSDKLVKKFLSTLEVEQIRDACEDKRELALVDLMISNGMRVSEICNAKISDIDWDKRTVLVLGKGGKQRYAPLSERAKKHLREYINERKGNSEYLFCGVRHPYNKMQKNGVEKIVQNIGARVGLPTITVHCFRRYVATDLCRKGVDIKVIQYILGHSSFQTTSNYYVETDISKVIYMHNLYAD